MSSLIIMAYIMECFIASSYQHGDKVRQLSVFWICHHRICNIEQGTITSSCISIIYRSALIILKASSTVAFILSVPKTRANVLAESRDLHLKWSSLSCAMYWIYITVHTPLYVCHCTCLFIHTHWVHAYIPYPFIIIAMIMIPHTVMHTKNGLCINLNCASTLHRVSTLPFGCQLSLGLPILQRIVIINRFDYAKTMTVYATSHSKLGWCSHFDCVIC